MTHPCARCRDSFPPVTWLDGVGLVCDLCRIALAPQVDLAGIYRAPDTLTTNGHHVWYRSVPPQEGPR